MDCYIQHYCEACTCLYTLTPEVNYAYNITELKLLYFIYLCIFVMVSNGNHVIVISVVTASSEQVMVTVWSGRDNLLQIMSIFYNDVNLKDEFIAISRDTYLDQV